MSGFYLNSENQIDNQNVPDEFVEITTELRLHRKQVRGLLAKIVHEFCNEEQDAEIGEIMEYALMSGETYYRSFFARIVGEALGLSSAKSLFIGEIIEMVHHYSTMQNNLPEFDNDDFRHSRQTCHKKYGASKTIIASNALDAMIYQFITNCDKVKISKSTRCDLVSVISKYSGKDGICGGQMMSLCNKNKPMYSDEMTRLKKLKQSVLLNAAIDCLFLLSDCSAKEKKAIKTFSNCICSMFNIYDKMQNRELNKEELLESAELLRDQIVSSLGIFDDRAKKMICFARYYFFCLQKQSYKNTSNIEIVKSEAETASAN